MNMFKSTKATSVKEYIASLTPERKEIILSLDALIQDSSKNFRPYFASNMIGYGSFPYRNYKNESIEWPVIALASQKKYVSMYVCALEDGEYLAEKYKDKLGKVNVGKSCIRFKKLEDVNLHELKKLLKRAAKDSGLK
jgi:hypothetical protein